MKTLFAIHRKNAFKSTWHGTESPACGQIPADFLRLSFSCKTKKPYLTDLEKDILDTWNELQKNPIDCSAAQRQVLQNDAKYPEIFFAIKSMPTTVLRPIEQMTESDIRYNLENQLAALAAKEGWQKYGQ